MTSKRNLTTRRWIRNSFLGWLVGILVVLSLSISFDAIGLEGFQFFVGIGMGGSVGFFQWLLIRKRFSAAWIWSNLIGFGIPFLASDLLSRYAGLSLGSLLLPVCVLIGAIITSMLQARMFKDSHGRLAWVFVNTLGWCLAAAMVAAVEYVPLLTGNAWVAFSANLILIIAGGGMIGFVTGRRMTATSQSATLITPPDRLSSLP